MNKQLLDSADALVGLFWTRLGTPAPKGRSGTVEEIERFADRGKPVLLYYCRRHVDLAQLDTAQLQAVRDFEASCRDKALYDTYGDSAELESKLMMAMTRLVRYRFPQDQESKPEFPKGTRLTAPPSRKERAALGAHLESHGKNHRLVIANGGTVDLHEVTVEIPPEATSFQLDVSELPVEILRPGERVGILATVFMGGGKSIFDLWLTAETPEGEKIRTPSKVSL